MSEKKSSDLRLQKRRHNPRMSSFLQLLEQEFNAFLLHPLLYSLPPLFLILVLLLVKWFFATPTTNRNLPPSPRKLPILGNFHQLGIFPHRSLRSLARQHGPLMLLHLGRLPTLVASSADAAREIMKTHDIVFANRPALSITRILLYDMKNVSVAPYGEYWRQMKSICVLQLLSNKMVLSFRFLREEETALMLNKISHCCVSSSPVDLSELFVTLTNDVVCRAAFGKKYSGEESGKQFKPLMREFIALLGGFNVGDLFPEFAWVDRVRGLKTKADKVARDIDEFLEGVVQERLAQIDNISGVNTVKGESRQNYIVDTLLQIHKDYISGVSIDRDSIKAILLDVYAAGTDTTSTVLEWTMTELLRHPRVMKKLQDEVRGILHGKQEIAEYDLEKMQYLKAVIKETLRLHPPIPLLVPRVASRDVKVMGYDIAAGTMVYINASAIGRDPASWDEPEEFRPERFLNCSIGFKGQDFELIPFGGGRRICPGIAFAMAINEYALANLVHKFDWELPGGAKGEDLDMGESPGLTMHKTIPLLAVATPCSWYSVN